MHILGMESPGMRVYMKYGLQDGVRDLNCDPVRAGFIWEIVYYLWPIWDASHILSMQGSNNFQGLSIWKATPTCFIELVYFHSNVHYNCWIHLHILRGCFKWYAHNPLLPRNTILLMCHKIPSHSNCVCKCALLSPVELLQICLLEIIVLLSAD